MNWIKKNFFFTLVIINFNTVLPHDTWNGEIYHQTSSPQYNTALKILKNVQFKGDEHILDIGCGSGDITAYMAQAVPLGSVIGIDSSASMINFAQKTHGRGQQCTFKNVSAHDFVFLVDSFNYVTSFSCLHWVKDLKSVLKKIAYVLKKQGRFLGNMAHTNHFFYESVMATIRSEKWHVYFNNFSEEPWYAQNTVTFSKLLDKVGLKPIKIIEEPATLSFANKEQFAAFIKNWIYAITHMAVLPIEKQEEFADDAIEYFLQKQIQFAPDGSFSFESFRFIFELIKE